MERKKLLNTGAFARLCRTTKETLFHYDRENLLRPCYVNEKGYRWYSVEQVSAQGVAPRPPFPARGGGQF